MNPRIFLASTAFAIVLVACGGGGGSSSDSNSSSNTVTAPTSTQAASVCSGTMRTSTLYDVFLNTANGFTQSLASRYVGLYGQTTDSNQCISVAASTAQADTTPGTIQVVTADNWNNAISFFDPVGTSVPGGVQLNQGVFVTCTNGLDTYRHVGILNPAGSASTFVSTNQIANVVKNTTFLSYECNLSNNTTTAGRSNTVITFTSDGSVVIADGTNGTTNIPAANTPSLFTTTGYNLNGNTLRWYLYQLPTGSGTKQVIVHTNQRADGIYNIDLFLQS